VAVASSGHELLDRGLVALQGLASLEQLGLQLGLDLLHVVQRGLGVRPLKHLVLSVPGHRLGTGDDLPVVGGVSLGEVDVHDVLSHLAESGRPG
jgi:hypothetical protein